MRLLLDEHFPPALAIALRARGHDVVAVAERRDLRGLEDRELFALAQAERRALVSEDAADLVPIARAHQAGAPHAGLILTTNNRFPRARRDTLGLLVTALDALLREHPEPSESTSLEHWL